MGEVKSDWSSVLNRGCQGLSNDGSTILLRLLESILPPPKVSEEEHLILALPRVTVKKRLIRLCVHMGTSFNRAAVPPAVRAGALPHIPDKAV